MTSFQTTLLYTVSIIVLLQLILQLYYYVGQYYFLNVHRDHNTNKITHFSFMKRLSEHSSKGVFTISIRNSDKIELKREILRLKNDKINQQYSLRAMLSWCKTFDKVLEFEKKYKEINPEYVDYIVQEKYKDIAEIDELLSDNKNAWYSIEEPIHERIIEIVNTIGLKKIKAFSEDNSKDKVNVILKTDDKRRLSYFIEDKKLFKPEVLLENLIKSILVKSDEDNIVEESFYI